MKQEIKEKREALKALSAPFKMLLKEGAINSINEGLAGYYAEQGHTELHSFNQWKQNGYVVKKGSKALLFWGQPQDVRKNSGQDTQQQPQQDGEGKEQFYPLAYLFSNLQVEKMGTRQNTPEPIAQDNTPAPEQITQDQIANWQPIETAPQMIGNMKVDDLPF